MAADKTSAGIIDVVSLHYWNQRSIHFSGNPLKATNGNLMEADPE